MAMHDRFRSVQVRLTTWYVLATAIFVIVFSATMLLFLQRRFEQRIDASQMETCQSFVQALIQEGIEMPSRTHSLEQVVSDETQEFVFRDGQVAVFLTDGTLVAEAHGLRINPRNAIPTRQLSGIAIASARETRFMTIELGEESYRLLTTPFSARDTDLIALTTRHRGEEAELLRSVAAMLWIGAPLWIAMSGLAGWSLVRKSLAPVAVMSAEAAVIGSADVTKRLRVANPGNELGFLATTFNALLDRLATTIEQQRRFMADASHELRTPISIVRGEAEVALTRPRSVEELRDALSIIQQQSVQLTSVVDDLFLLARADAGQRMLAPSRFYLNELLADAVAAVRTSAAGKEITLDIDASEDIEIFADERLLGRLFVSLLDNAVKYTPRGGHVAISLSCDPTRCQVAVRDSGRPIAQEERERIFERFHRGESRDTEGAGLGLSIARSIAQLHGGHLDLVPDIDTGNGNIFRTDLPRR